MKLNEIQTEKIWEALDKEERMKVIGEEAYLQCMRKTFDHIVDVLSKGPELTDLQFANFCSKLRSKLNTVQFQNGTFVGVRVAQDITQPITQGKLSSFYTVGLGKEKHDSLKVYKRLLSNTDNPSETVCYIYFKHLDSIGQLKMHANKFIYLVFNDFVESIKVYANENNAAAKDVPKECEFPVVRIEFSKEKMFRYRITLAELASVLLMEEMEVLPSPKAFNELYVSRTYDSGVLKETLKSVANVFYSRLEINRHDDMIRGLDYEMKVVRTNGEMGKTVLEDIPSFVDVSSLYEKFSYVIMRRKDGLEFDEEMIGKISSIVIRAKDEGELRSSRDDKRLYIIPDFNRSHTENMLIGNMIKSHIGSTRICGIKGITEIDYDYDLDVGKAFIKARGANLRRILTIPGIDVEHTNSTSVKDTYEALGLEAAIKVFKRQMLQCIPQESQTSQMKENIDLVSNAVSMTGSMVGIDRRGMEKAKSGFLTLMTFEDSFSSMFSTAKGCEDNLNEVASCIVMGKKIRPYLEHDEEKDF